MTAYAWSIATGVRPAGKWHRLACVRHLYDLVASQAGEGPWVFRPELADKAFRIFRLFKHYKGRWAGQPMVLEPWQQFVVGSLMGWVSRESGLRRFRNAFVELPRGNGKSMLAGGMLILLTFFDGESGAEGYSVATKKDQAKISFSYARQIVLRSQAIRDHVVPLRHNLHNPDTESKLEALGADADTLDGLRPHVVVADEIHKMTHADLIEVMESGMGTRDQPVLLEITTAGLDDESIYGQHWLLSTRVLDETIDLPGWFAFIAAADPEDDWTLVETAIKANPNYGVTIKPEFLETEQRKAIANPAEQAKYRRLYLGQKTSTVESYFSLDDWRACPPLPDDATLLTRPCWIGLDLSSAQDVTAAVCVWSLPNDEIAVKPIFWLPSEQLEDRSRRDRAPYDRWAAEGWLRTVEGKTIDFPAIRTQVADLFRTWKAREVCADPWKMYEMGPALQEQDHVRVVLIGQNVQHLSEPTKKLQGLILERRVRHDHNPLMALMVSNCVTRADEKENVLLSKRRSRGRIDGPQALVNVISRLPTRAPAVGAMWI